jgi:hypothetical protein
VPVGSGSGTDCSVLDGEPAIRFGGESARSKAVHDGSPEDFVPAR